MKLRSWLGVRIAIAAVGAALCSCGQPSDWSAPCPTDKQFCVVTPDGGGCVVTQLVCCEDIVPPCAGRYSGTLPEGCTTGNGMVCP